MVGGVGGVCVLVGVVLVDGDSWWCWCGVWLWGGYCVGCVIWLLDEFDECVDVCGYDVWYDFVVGVVCIWFGVCCVLGCVFWCVVGWFVCWICVER